MLSRRLVKYTSKAAGPRRVGVLAPRARTVVSRGPVRVMAVHLTATVDTYPTKLAELQKAPGPHFVVFSADNDPSTGLPWCPDCVRALPPIRAAAARAGASLLEVTVGPRTAWRGNATHPFRVDPSLKLTGVPTLFAWGAAGPARRLGPELEACASPGEVEQLLEKTKFMSG